MSSQRTDQPWPEEGRVPPQNPEVEMQVLAGIMLEPQEAPPLVRDILEAEDFYLTGHQTIYRLACQLHDAGTPPDAVAMLDALRSRGLLEQVGGSGVIMGMLNSVPTAAGVVHHARIVADKSRRRKIIRSATRMVDAAHNPDLPLDDLAAMYQEFAVLASEGRGDNEARVAKDIMRQYWSELGTKLEEGNALIAAGKKPEPYGIRTGIPHLDNLWRGLRPAHAYVIAGYPAQGKSALLLQIAKAVAGQGIPTLLFSLEMGDMEIGERLLCMETRQGNNGYSSDQLDRPWDLQDDPDWKTLSQAYNKVAGLPLYIVSAGDITPAKFKSLCRTLTLKHKIGLICQDYLQIFDNPKGLSIYESVTHGALAIQSVKQDLRIPVITACQLAKEGQKDRWRKPTMADIRDSGYIQQMGNVITLIWQDPDDWDAEKVPCKCELIVDKCRGGKRGTVKAWFYGPTTQFAERAQDDGEPVKAKAPSYSGKAPRIVKTSGDSQD